MRLVAACFALIAFASSVHAQDLPADAFERDRALRGAAGIDRLVTDMRLGKRDADARVLRWLERNPGADARARRSAWLALCAARFREERFDEAINVCGEGDALQPGAASQMLGLLQVLRQAGPVTWSAPGVVIPTREGRMITVSRGDVSVEAMIDSGAEVGFVSESVARQLGGRPLTGSATIGTTTTPVAGGMVVFDALDVAGVQLRNVSAVVLTDEQSAYAELTLVLNLATLTSMRRVAFLDHGTRLALGDAAPRVRGRTIPLYWDESGVGFAMDFAGGRRGVHFDTGSSRTWLFPTAATALSEQERATREPHRRTIGGLGGERVEDASLYRNVTLGIGHEAWRFDEIQMAENDENGEAARVGIGMFERFESVVLDFERMRMSVAD